MSIKLVNDVLTSDIRGPGRKLVAVVLAEHADAQGECFPSQRRIALMAGLSIRSVQRALQTLKKSGIVEIAEPGTYHPTSTYRIRGDRLSPLMVLRGDVQGRSEATLVAGRGDAGDGSGATRVSPKPSVEPVERTVRKEPSVVASNHTNFFEERYRRFKPERDVEREAENSCIECGADVDYYTPEGEAFCERHGPGLRALLGRTG